MASGLIPESFLYTPPALKSPATNREAQCFVQGQGPERDAGYITRESPFALYLWNGTGNDAVLRSITGDEGAEGIVWDRLTPAIIHALRSARVIVTITVDGPLAFSGMLIFVSSCNSIFFTITGTRAPHMAGDTGTLFVPHNWDDGLDESLAWLTDVMIAHDRTEQRVRLRTLPRRSFTLRLLTTGAARRTLEQWLAARKTRSLFVPVWRDEGRLDTAVATGDTTVHLNPAGYDYAEGRWLAIWAGDKREIRKITGIGQNYLAVESAFTADWPIGSRIAPCRYGLVRGERRISRFTEDAGTCSFTLQVLDESPLPAFISPELYRDTMVCPFIPSWTGDDETVDNHWLSLDNDTGVVEYDIMSIEPVFSRSASFMLVGRERIDLFLRFLFACAGRLAPFWLASAAREFELAETAKEGDTAIVIGNIDYGSSLSGSPARSHIQMVTTDGAVIRRMITGTMAQPDGTEKWLIDPCLPAAVSAATLNRCAWLELVRLDADEVHLHWVDGNCLQVTLPVVTLP